MMKSIVQRFSKYKDQKGKKASRGFTLIEAMVAISILSLAVTGPLLIAQKGLGSAIYAKDQITAFYLAQEAVEYIRNIRDTNRITGSSWLNGLNECKETGAGEKCEIDAHLWDFNSPDAIKACTTGTCDKLSIYKNGAESYYGYTPDPGWTPVETQYTRTVKIDERAAPGKEALISVQISWKTNLFEPERVFTIREYMFNF